MNVQAMSLLGVGFVLGLKHALDADHLLAVSTIVSQKKNFWSSSFVGALWGAGHTTSLLVVGLLVVAFHIQIPGKLALSMEFAVGVMLVLLGANVLWKIRRGATFHMHSHTHHHRVHVHPHLHPVDDAKHHTHDSHSSVGTQPFFIGMVHGLAGSAALMLLVLATISSRLLALAYVGIFGLGSAGGMVLMSALIGLPFSLTAKQEKLNTVVRTAAGLMSLLFGLFYAWHTGIAEGLFL